MSGNKHVCACVHKLTCVSPVILNLCLLLLPYIYENSCFLERHWLIKAWKN